MNDYELCPKCLFLTVLDNDVIKPGMTITLNYDKNKVIGKIICAEQVSLNSLKIIGEIKDMDVGLRFGHNATKPKLGANYEINKLEVLDFGLFNRNNEGE
jgi:hypothetical protein